jgi:hypothetical protein
MGIQTREIYRSAPNGDRWLLAHDIDSGRVFVRHEPNVSSGGHSADIELGAFLVGKWKRPRETTAAPTYRDVGEVVRRLRLGAGGLAGPCVADSLAIRSDRNRAVRSRTASSAALYSVAALEPSTARAASTFFRCSRASFERRSRA